MATAEMAEKHAAAGWPTSAGEPDGKEGSRRRLLHALHASIADVGYSATTVADIVARARTSRRTFYEYFADRQACYVALLADHNGSTVRKVAAAVDQDAHWQMQVRQAVETWFGCAEAEPALALSWIQEAPGLGEAAHRLHLEFMESFIVLVQTLTDTDQFRSAGIGPVSRLRAMMLLGGLYQLTEATFEQGLCVSDVTEEAVNASVALIGARDPSPITPTPRQQKRAR